MEESKEWTESTERIHWWMMDDGLGMMVQGWANIEKLASTNI